MDTIKLTYGELKQKLSYVNEIKVKKDEEDNKMVLYLKSLLKRINRAVKPIDDEMNEDIQETVHIIEVKNARTTSDGKLIYEIVKINDQEQQKLTYTVEGELNKQEQLKKSIKEIMNEYDKKEVEFKFSLCSLDEIPELKEIFDEYDLEELKGFLFN